MSSLFHALGASASGMEAQAQRLRHVSENIANADTPGYRRKVVSFQQIIAQTRAEASGGVRPAAVRLDPRDLPRVFDPGHALADESGHYDGSNVDLVVEIADSREAQRSYEANLRMFDQVRQMSRALLDVLRR
jgi:flagellar basal-body rod protein FlgC